MCPMEVKERHHFPESFNRQAVERVLDSSLPIVRVAEVFGLHETLLRRWMKQVSEPSPARRPATPVPYPADLAAKTARLRRDLSPARMERDILEKATLIFGAASRRSAGSWMSAAPSGRFA